MKNELIAIINQLKQLRSKAFGTDEVVYNHVGRAMSNLIEAKKTLEASEGQ